MNRPWLLLADRSSEGLLVGVRVKRARGLGEPFSGPRVEVCVCSVRELAYEHERSGGRKARRCLDPSTKMFFFSRLKGPLCVKQMRGSRVFILVAKIHIACLRPAHVHACRRDQDPTGPGGVPEELVVPSLHTGHLMQMFLKASFSEWFPGAILVTADTNSVGRVLDHPVSVLVCASVNMMSSHIQK